MKHLGSAVLLAASLVACSPQARKPLVLDKAQIDLANTSSMLGEPPTSTNWWCVLAHPRASDNPGHMLVALSQRVVYVTDGRQMLATGQIIGLSPSGGKVDMLRIAFPTPAIRENLEHKLGIHHPDISGNPTKP